MHWFDRHVLVCTGNHCLQKGANPVINRLRFEFMRRKLNHTMHLNTCGTIDLCDCGPNMVIYPDNIVYSGVHESDIPDIIKHLQGGPVVERLLLTADTPAEQKRHAFYAALRERGNSLPEAETTALVAEQDLGDGWIAEQLRRGFMAKKPDKETGEDRYSLTTMAAKRYGLLPDGK